MTIGLMDGDMYAFRSAVSADNDPEEIALLRLDGFIRDSLQHVEEYKIALTGENNFRKVINPEYKANRKNKARPRHLDACRKYLVEEFKAIICDGYEADDFLGFNSTNDTIIFTNDKDLMQIPGEHYNPVSKEYIQISEIDGLRFFYKQALIGDVADNIKGVDGIGKVRAGKLIDHLETEKEMHDVVFGLYQDPDRYRVNMDCLWVWRNEGEKYSDRDVSKQIRGEVLESVEAI
jgi:5'-3' exonuclease